MSPRWQVRRAGLAMASAVSALLLTGCSPSPNASLSPLAEQGKALFWGRGRCATCHAISGEGGADRCPDLGTTSEQPGTLAERAANRIRGKSAIQYLAQSLYDPASYVVAGFPGHLMPVADEAPLSLTDDEGRALVAYLATVGGGGLPSTSEMDSAIRLARSERRLTAPLVLASTDSNAGRAVYEKLKCGACHVIEGVTDPEGADAARKRGPDLTGLAAVQGAFYLKDSVARPNAVVVAGPGGAWLAEDGRTSRMPVYPEMTEQELEDVTAFLLTLH